jgi:hypothetical protein
MGKAEGKRPLLRPRTRCVSNSKMNLRETGWGGMDWSGLADSDPWMALVGTVMNLTVP